MQPRFVGETSSFLLEDVRSVFRNAIDSPFAVVLLSDDVSAVRAIVSLEEADHVLELLRQSAETVPAPDRLSGHSVACNSERCAPRCPRIHTRKQERDEP